MMIGLPMILFLIFMVLKLTGTIDWSWWFISLPLVLAMWMGCIWAATGEAAKEACITDRGTILFMGNLLAIVPAIIYTIILFWIF